MSASDVLEELNKIGQLAMKYKDNLLHAKLCDVMNKKYQGKYSTIFQMLHESAVKKYVFEPSGKIVWIVRGKERDYLIYPDAPYCHCMNYYIHVVNGQAQVCIHLVAQRIASVLNMYETITETDKIYEELMNEWRSLEK